MEHERWLLAANALFVAGGVLAYFTSIGLDIIVALSLVAAMAGLWRTRSSNVWIDRAASAAAGAWAVLAVLILIPYITVEEGVSLWSLRGYAALGIATASLGMLAWNICALRAQPGGAARWQRPAAIHGVLVLAALWYALGSDGSSITYMVRGFEVTSYDLQMAPALAAIPGISWMLARRQA